MDADIKNHMDLHRSDFEGLMIPTGHEAAVIGTVLNEDMDGVRAVMSVQRIMAKLVADCTAAGEDDPQLRALEWWDYNIEGAYMGPNNPIYVDEIERGDNDAD